ncbi:MAG: hypothetical protein IJU25_03735 [Lachnospiraceae bacterium]|nr:hypothetical protein [Lachnospiraceae bacterium]
MTKKKWIMCALILAAALTFAGCGDKSKVPQGYYILSEITEGNVTVSEKDLDDYGLEDSYVVFEKGGDGYLVLIDTPSDFTYNKKKGILETEYGDVALSASKKTVTLSDSRVSMTFEKSKEDAPKKPKVFKAGADEPFPLDGDDMYDDDFYDDGPDDDFYDDGSDEETEEILKFWNGDWFGWWEVDGFMNEYDQFEGQKFSILATSELGADGTGRIVIKDGEGVMADVECSNNGYGLTDVGTMVSESGTFIDWDIAHADWNIDPGTYPDKHDGYLEIDGRVEDENGDRLFSYTIHLVKWGLPWDGFDEEDLPEDYDWYIDQINSGKSMPDECPNW